MRQGVPRGVFGGERGRGGTQRARDVRVAPVDSRLLPVAPDCFRWLRITTCCSRWLRGRSFSALSGFFPRRAASGPVSSGELFGCRALSALSPHLSKRRRPTGRPPDPLECTRPPAENHLTVWSVGLPWRGAASGPCGGRGRSPEALRRARAVLGRPPGDPREAFRGLSGCPGVCPGAFRRVRARPRRPLPRPRACVFGTRRDLRGVRGRRTMPERSCLCCRNDRWGVPGGRARMGRVACSASGGAAVRPGDPEAAVGRGRTRSGPRPARDKGPAGPGPRGQSAGPGPGRSRGAGGNFSSESVNERKRTTCARDFTPSFLKMRPMCVSTVFTLMFMRSAIC